MARVPTVTRRKMYLARHVESCFLSSFTIPKKYLPVRKFTLEAEVQLYSFCNLGVRRGGGGGGGVQGHAPAALPPTMRPNTYHTGGRVGRRPVWTDAENLATTSNDPWTVTSRYND